MTASRLIIRLDDGAPPEPSVPVALALAAVADVRIGEAVVLAWSVVPGLWHVCGEAVLEGVRRDGDTAFLMLAALQTFDPPVVAVTTSSAEADKAGLPYTFDEMDAETYAATVGRVGRDAPTPLARAAEEGQVYSATAPGAAPASWPFPEGLDPAHPLCQAVRLAYAHHCPVTKLPLPSRNGRREGMVLPLHPAGGEMPTKISEALVLTGTLGFYYLGGLFGLSSGFGFVFHTVVAPEIIALVRERNPEMRLALPRDPRHWPDLTLIRLHRDHYGL